MIKQKHKILAIFIILAFCISLANEVSASVTDDFEYYQKYQLYPKYEKKQKYDKYKKYKRNKDKYGFDSAKEKAAAKDGYNKYKLYKKDPKKYSSYAQYEKQYKKYSKYKKYVTPYSKYSQYKKYKNYNKSQYERYKNYGSAEYKAGYDRYVAFMNDLENVTSETGPEIRVGLWSKNHLDAQADPFRITANKSFTITNCNNSTVIGTIPIGTAVRIAHDSDSGNLQVYDSTDLIISEASKTLAGEKVCLQAEDGNSADMIFDVNTPDNLSKGEYDRYRGKIKLQESYSTGTYGNGGLYSDLDFVDNDTEHANRRIWVINILPLEQYMWGYGEMSSGGIGEHAKAMVVAARSYARWYIEYAIKWGDVPQNDEEDGEGFDLLAYSYNQIYKGYDYEIGHSFIPEAARATNGIVMKYEDEYVLGAYCSNTDGNTRALAGYPYLVSVPDPYGKIDNPSAGNHMWGMSANGALVLARDEEWSYTAILSYYYTNISIVKDY